MKRLIALLSSVAMLTACGNNRNDFPINSEMRFISIENNCFNNGVIYGSEPTMFLDLKTLEKTPICAKPNCTHNSYDCLANVVGSTPIFYNDYIYYFDSDCGIKNTSDGKEFYINSKLMKASLKTSELETVCEFHDCTPPYKNLSSYAVYRNELYFIGDNQNPVKDDYDNIVYSNVGGSHYLCCINLNTGEYKNMGSIYDDDKQYEASNYSSNAILSGIYKDKLYIGYSFVKDLDSLTAEDATAENIEFTYLNFEFDFKTKQLSESNLPYSRYMNDNTYTYYDYNNEHLHVIHNNNEVNLPAEMDGNMVEWSEFNEKLFSPQNNYWLDLTDCSAHSIGKYDGYSVVGYNENSYILNKNGRVEKLTEEELLALDKE